MKKPAAFVLLGTMTACTSLQPVKDTSDFIAKKNPTFVVITTEQSENNDPIVVARPQLDAGNLTGTLEGEPFAVPMRTIRTVRAVQPDRKKTMYALLGGAFSVGLVTFLMVNKGSKIDRSPICVPEGHRGDLPYCE